MKDKFKYLIETQWAPVVTTMIITITTMITCFCWTISRIDNQSDRIDKQSARTDRLYEMFIDLIKEKNK